MKILLLLLLATPALAQDGRPDPYPPARYFPLDVGTRLTYEGGGSGFDVRSHAVVEVLGDSTVGGLRYAVIRTTRTNSVGTHDPVGPWIDLVRLDPVLVYPVVRRGGSEVPYAPPAPLLPGDPAGPTLPPLPCPLDARYQTTVYCPLVPSDVAVDAAIEDLITIGRSAPVKRYRPVGGGATGDRPVEYAYGNDLGPIEFRAVVGGRDLVLSLTGFQRITADEVGPASVDLAVSVHPNPVRDGASVVLALGAPSHVTVEAFDMRGRRVAPVHDGPLGAGEHRLPLDTTALPAGIYVVRVASASGAVVRRLVVVR